MTDSAPPEKSTSTPPTSGSCDCAAGAAQVAATVAAEHMAERVRLIHEPDPDGLLSNYLAGWREAEKVACELADRIGAEGHTQ